MLNIAIYAQHTTMAGRICRDDDLIDSESDDLIIFTGEREELQEIADFWKRMPPIALANSNTDFRNKVGFALADELEFTA